MIIFCVLMACFSIFLSVPMILVSARIKQRKDSMSEEKWSSYFSDLSIKDYKKKIAVLVGLPLILCSFLNYFCLCRKYEKKQAAFISFLIFTFFAFARAAKYIRHSNEINRRIWNIKKTASEEEENVKCYNVSHNERGEDN